MADPDDPADAAARLEQALERIAATVARAASPVAQHDQSLSRSVDTAEAVARLDSLIQRIRTTLDHPSEG